MPPGAVSALCMRLIWYPMTAIDLITLLSLLVEGRYQLSFARDPSSTMKRRGGGGGGGITSKSDGLLRSNLPLGDTILRGASYFVTGLSELPLASFMLGASLNGPIELLQAIYGLGVGQIPPIRTATRLLQVGRRSKRTLPTSTCSYILGGGTNRLYKVL